MNRRVLCCVLLFCNSIFCLAQSEPNCTIVQPSLYAESLSCSNKSVQIHIVAPQPNLTFLWSCSGESLGALPPLAKQSGWYIVKSMIKGSTCWRLDSIFINENNQKPKAVAQIQTYQYANSFTFELDAHGSTKGENILYFWWSSSEDVNIEDENASLTFTNMPGTYYLKVIDMKNGCSSICSASNLPLEPGLFVEK